MKEYSKLFEILPFPGLLLQPEGDKFVIKNANSEYCRLSGQKKQELLGRYYPEIYSGNENSEANQRLRVHSLRKAYDEGNPHTVECLRQDFQSPVAGHPVKRYWKIENRPITEDGKVAFILNLAMDRTPEILEEREKQDVQRELADKLEKQQHFIHKNPDGLYSLDLEGNFVSFNEGLVKLTEAPEEELSRMSFLPFCAPHDEERTLNFFHKAIEGEKQEFEADFVSAKGKKIVLLISLIPMRINGKITGTYGIAKDITNLRKTEEALLRSQRKYKALVQEGSELTGILTLEGKYKFISENVSSVLGLSPEDYLGRNASEFIHPEDVEQVKNDYSRLEHQKQTRLKPYRFRDKEGKWRWMETTATDLRNDPYVQGIVVNSREVTDLMERNQEIRQIYERYKLAASATEDLIYDWDLKADKVVRFHKGRKKIFGYDREEIDERDFWKRHIHPEELPVLKDLLRKTLADPSQNNIKTHYRLRRADGTYAHLVDRGRILRSESGEPVRLIGATSDMSDIIEKEEALRVANKRFNYAMRATNEVIWDWDFEREFIKRSRSFEKIFGYARNEKSSIKEFWFERIAAKDREAVRVSLETALADPKIRKWKCEYRFMKSNGEKAYVIDRGFILRNGEGEAVRMIGAVLDVTESRRLLKEVKKQNRVLREVAWEQAHIVRAPLARLKGLLHVLEMEYFDQWNRQELFTLINTSTDEIDEVIKNIIRKTENIEKKQVR